MKLFLSYSIRMIDCFLGGKRKRTRNWVLEILGILSPLASETP